MPFLDLVVLNDPALRTGRRTQLLVDPADIRGLRETEVDQSLLLRLGWSAKDAATETGNETAVGITLASGATVWAAHDLDDILRGIDLLRDPAWRFLVVMVDDLPQIPAQAA